MRHATLRTRPLIGRRMSPLAENIFWAGVIIRIPNPPSISNVLSRKPMSTAEPETTPESRLIRALSARFEIDSERESSFEATCSLQVQTDNASRTTPASVGLAPVSTLVCRGKGGIPGTGYVVPTFAVHWGVIVRASLFHLRYDSKNKAVQFDWRPWKPKDGDSRYDVDVVGQTPYSTDDLIEIGTCTISSEVG